MWKVSSSLAPSSVLLSPEDIIQLDAVRERVCVNWRINMYFDLDKLGVALKTLVLEMAEGHEAGRSLSSGKTYTANSFLMMIIFMK